MINLHCLLFYDSNTIILGFNLDFYTEVQDLSYLEIFLPCISCSESSLAFCQWVAYRVGMRHTSTMVLAHSGIPPIPFLKTPIWITCSVLSSSLRVGDLALLAVLLEKNQLERVLADLVLLRTSLAESSGTCFIRTDQIEGERLELGLTNYITAGQSQREASSNSVPIQPAPSQLERGKNSWLDKSWKAKLFGHHYCKHFYFFTLLRTLLGFLVVLQRNTGSVDWFFNRTLNEYII
jgi:hypothetical protein